MISEGTSLSLWIKFWLICGPGWSRLWLWRSLNDFMVTEDILVWDSQTLNGQLHFKELLFLVFPDLFCLVRLRSLFFCASPLLQQTIRRRLPANKPEKKGNIDCFWEHEENYKRINQSEQDVSTTSLTILLSKIYIISAWHVLDDEICRLVNVLNMSR